MTRWDSNSRWKNIDGVHGWTSRRQQCVFAIDDNVCQEHMSLLPDRVRELTDEISEIREKRSVFGPDAKDGGETQLRPDLRNGQGGKSSFAYTVRPGDERRAQAG